MLARDSEYSAETCYDTNHKHCVASFRQKSYTGFEARAIHTQGASLAYELLVIIHRKQKIFSPLASIKTKH